MAIIATVMVMACSIQLLFFFRYVTKLQRCKSLLLCTTLNYEQRILPQRPLKSPRVGAVPCSASIHSLKNKIILFITIQVETSHEKEISHEKQICTKTLTGR